MALLNKILLIWLTRNLSEKLLTELIYSVLQFEFEGLVRERELLIGRTEQLKELIDKFFQCFPSEGLQVSEIENN